MTTTKRRVSSLSYGSLISAQLWDRLVAKLQADDPNIDQALAERIINQTLGFLCFLAQDYRQSTVPSKLVDLGWHTFILYTREYDRFCDRHFGRFIHHSPADVPGEAYEGSACNTVEAMRANNFEVDEELWTEDTRCDHEWRGRGGMCHS